MFPCYENLSVTKARLNTHKRVNLYYHSIIYRSSVFKIKKTQKDRKREQRKKCEVTLRQIGYHISSYIICHCLRYLSYCIKTPQVPHNTPPWYFKFCPFTVIPDDILPYSYSLLMISWMRFMQILGYSQMIQSCIILLWNMRVSQHNYWT